MTMFQIDDESETSDDCCCFFPISYKLIDFDNYDTKILLVNGNTKISESNTIFFSSKSIEITQDGFHIVKKISYDNSIRITMILTFKELGVSRIFISGYMYTCGKQYDITRFTFFSNLMYKNKNYRNVCLCNYE